MGSRRSPPAGRCRACKSSGRADIKECIRCHDAYHAKCLEKNEAKLLFGGNRMLCHQCIHSPALLLELSSELGRRGPVGEDGLKRSLLDQECMADATLKGSGVVSSSDGSNDASSFNEPSTSSPGINVSTLRWDGSQPATLRSFASARADEFDEDDDSSYSAALFPLQAAVDAQSDRLPKQSVPTSEGLVGLLSEFPGVDKELVDVFRSFREEGVDLPCFFLAGSSREAPNTHRRSSISGPWPSPPFSSHQQQRQQQHFGGHRILEGIPLRPDATGAFPSKAGEQLQHITSCPASSDQLRPSAAAAAEHDAEDDCMEDAEWFQGPGLRSYSVPIMKINPATWAALPQPPLTSRRHHHHPNLPEPSAELDKEHHQLLQQPSANLGCCMERGASPSLLLLNEEAAAPVHEALQFPPLYRNDSDMSTCSHLPRNSCSSYSEQLPALSHGDSGRWQLDGSYGYRPHSHCEQLPALNSCSTWGPPGYPQQQEAASTRVQDQGSWQLGRRPSFGRMGCLTAGGEVVVVQEDMAAAGDGLQQLLVLIKQRDQQLQQENATLRPLG